MSTTQTTSRSISLIAEPTTPASPDEVLFGSTVSFTDRRNGIQQTFTIVSPGEAKPQAGSLSVESPVASALLHHRAGELVEVSTPSGLRPLLITAISQPNLPPAPLEPPAM